MFYFEDESCEFECVIIDFVVSVGSNSFYNLVYFLSNSTLKLNLKGNK